MYGITFLERQIVAAQFTGRQTSQLKWTGPVWKQRKSTFGYCRSSSMVNNRGMKPEDDAVLTAKVAKTKELVIAAAPVLYAALNAVTLWRKNLLVPSRQTSFHVLLTAHCNLPAKTLATMDLSMSGGPKGTGKMMVLM